jgi:hypothetical protein
MVADQTVDRPPVGWTDQALVAQSSPNSTRLRVLKPRLPFHTFVARIAPEGVPPNGGLGFRLSNRIKASITSSTGAGTPGGRRSAGLDSTAQASEAQDERMAGGVVTFVGFTCQ